MRDCSYKNDKLCGVVVCAYQSVKCVIVKSINVYVLFLLGLWVKKSC